MSTFLENEPEKGFWADKWEDITYWYAEKAKETKMFGFWVMVWWMVRSAWMTLVWQWVRRIIRICEWIPVLWNNYDWDYAYLLVVIDFKLARMQKAIREGSCIQESIDEKVGQIQECRDLIKQIQDENFVKEEEALHEAKWGELKINRSPAEEGKPYVRLNFYYDKTANDQELTDKASEESMEIHTLEDQRRQAAYDKLFALIGKNIRGWWD